MVDDELQSRFSPNRPLEPDVAAELQSIMRLHDLSPEDLYLKWDSYCLQMETDAHDVTLSAVRRLKQTILDSLEKDNSRRAQVKTAATPRPSAGARGGAGGADVFGMLDGLVPSTPATGAKLKSGGGSASGLKRKLETPRSGAGLGSSPAGRGMDDQLKAMKGTQ
jgi:DNA polymerase alpha subunit B